jgi:capsular polysaccharide transport system permease protein
MATIPLLPPDGDTDPVAQPVPPPADGPAALFQTPQDMVPHRFAPDPPTGAARRWYRLGWLRTFALLVLLPTLALAAFEYGMATDQYESEAHFVLRSPGSPTTPASGMAQMLGMDSSQSATDGKTVVDYLTSHDAVASLTRSQQLPTVYRRPEADLVSRLWDPASPERLLRYFRGMVDVEVSHEDNIVRLRVRAFRPRDAKALADAMLALGERRVNELNQRLLENRIAAARDALQSAEAGIGSVQTAMDRLRQSSRDIDPERTGSANVGMTAQLEADLAQARARLAALTGAIRQDSPQVVALAAQVRALEQQVGAERARLAGSPSATAVALGKFETLRRGQELGAKRVEAATVALDAARDQALRQQLYLVRVVEPNLPVDALYPKRLKLVAIVFAALLLVYAIGWLILAGVREHAA